MSKLFRKSIGSAIAKGSAGRQATGITHRDNPPSGDVGPDAPGGGGGTRRRPPGPRGRNRRLGGDVRSPLA
jgi:hypothetical protein